MRWYRESTHARDGVTSQKRNRGQLAEGVEGRIKGDKSCRVKIRGSLMGRRQPRLLGDSGMRRDVPSTYREIVCQFEDGKLCASDFRKLPL